MVEPVPLNTMVSIGYAGLVTNEMPEVVVRYESNTCWPFTVRGSSFKPIVMGRFMAAPLGGLWNISTVPAGHSSGS